MPSQRWFTSILFGLCAGLLAACAAPPQPATSTYTLTTGTPVAPTASRTALPPTITATPLSPSETPRVTYTPRPTSTPRPTISPTPTLPPWTPSAYTPPTAGPLALSVDNAGQIEEVAKLGDGRPIDVAWSPDGLYLAVAAIDWVDVYTTQAWQLVAHYPLPAWEVAFSPTGDYLVVVADNTIRWLDLATGKVFRTQTSAVASVSDMHFSPGGSWLALVGNDCPRCGEPNYALEVLNAATGASLYSRVDRNFVPVVAFSHDGRSLALVFEAQVILLDANTGIELMTFNSGGSSAAFTADDSGLLVMTETGLQMLTLATGHWVTVPSPLLHDRFLFSPNDRIVLSFSPAVGTDDCGCDQLTLWDYATGRVLVSRPASSNVYLSSFSPDSGQVAWVTYGDGVSVLNVAEPDELTTLPYATTPTAVTFGPPTANNTVSVLVGDGYGDLAMWDIGLGQPSAETSPFASSSSPDMSTVPGGITSLRYTAHNGLLIAGYAIGEDSGEVRLINRTGQVLAALPCANIGYQLRPVVAADGASVAAVCDDYGSIQVWDSGTGAPIAFRTGLFISTALEWRGEWFGVMMSDTGLALMPADGRGPALQLPRAFVDGQFIVASPSGRWIASSSEDADIFVWETGSDLPPAILAGHRPSSGEGYIFGLTALAFSPNTDLLASAGYDGTVRLWDPATGTELRRFDVGSGSVTDLAFSADGRYLAASSSAGVVRVYGLPSP